MPRNGSGTYSLPQAPFTAGTVISSAAVNSDLTDIGSALTGSLPRDGQVGMTGQLKHTDGSIAIPSLSFTNDTTLGFSRSGGVLTVSVGGLSVGSFTSTGWTGAITGNGAVPIGTVVHFAGSAAPTFWALCFGQAISRTTFAALFTALGTTYGSGDGSTTFNLPDGRDYALVGKGNMGGSDAGRLTTAFFGSDPTVLGNAGGQQTRTLLTANLPAYAPAGTIGNSITQTDVANQLGLVRNTAGNVQFGGTGTGGTTVPISNSNVSVTSTFTGTAQGGTSSAFAAVPPSLIVNTIIYAGA